MVETKWNPSVIIIYATFIDGTSTSWMLISELEKADLGVNHRLAGNEK